MTELWKDIEGYDGKYQVSNLGRVRSVEHIGLIGGFNHSKTMVYKSTIRKQCQTISGYLIVPMHKPLKNISVHRAVALAFVPGYFDGAQVNHKDENKHNNRWDNLEWVTCKENINYGSHNSKCKAKRDAKQAYPVTQYSLDGSIVTTYTSQNEAARAMGVDPHKIKKAIDKAFPINGYLFKRKTN